jgi:hypothetical protein
VWSALFIVASFDPQGVRLPGAHERGKLLLRITWLSPGALRKILPNSLIMRTG